MQLLERDVESDLDTVMFTDEMFEKATWSVPPTKTPISFRVDPDILAFFRRRGGGYQSRMSAVLRAYMDGHKTKR